MELRLSEEQSLLKDNVERFLKANYGFDVRQCIVASEAGFSRDMWRRFAEFGWLAAPLPEEQGGLGGSLFDAAVILEGFGRHLVVEPYLSSVILFGGLLRLGGSEEQRETLLPAIAEGRLTAALAYAEPQSRFDLFDVETRATQVGRGFRLEGHKAVVFDAPSAERIIVSARSAGSSREREGISLFLLDPSTPGLSLRGYPTVDGLHAAELTLSEVEVGPEALIGAEGEGLAPLERVLDEASIAVSAEAVGIMAALVEQTAEYLKTRKQFGQPLASFQVLQHRVVDMFAALELSRALVYRAAQAAAGEDPVSLAKAASAAKTQIGRAGRFVGQQAIQLHGGIGMTDETAVGHYFKRLSMIGLLFGDADHHLERFAALS